MAIHLRHKFKNVPTEVGNAKFSSKKEARHWSELLLAKKSGELLFALRQVPFHHSSGVRYIVDFVEFWKDGTIRFVDTKGVKTPMYKVKKKMIEAEFPITITEA
jgi:hypothetical protein